eukprot:jgi/Galph1/305/GphlegSOOS_G5019.1
MSFVDCGVELGESQRSSNVLDLAGSDSTLKEFLEHLLSLPLKEVSRELVDFNRQVEQLELELQQVVASRYRELLKIYSGAVSASSFFESLEEKITVVSKGIPSLLDKIAEAREEIEKSTLDGSVQSGLAWDHTELNDLIGTPALLTSLIKRGNLETVADLLERFDRLNILLTHSPLIRKLCEQLNDVKLLLVANVFQRLLAKISLSDSLRLITVLKRTTSFDEQSLRVLFLYCRCNWMLSTMNDILNPETQSAFLQFSDDFKNLILEVTTQFLAVFPEKEQNTDTFSEGILEDFLFLWTSFYVNITKKYLHSVYEGSSLSTVIEQVDYCGQSLGRIGIDFRPLLGQEFEEASVSLFSKYLDQFACWYWKAPCYVFYQALSALEIMLEGFNWYPSSRTAVTHSEARQGQDDISSASLPYSLLEFPALSVFFNGIVSALNELRHVAFVSQTEKYARLLESALYEAAAILRDFGGAEGVLLPQAQKGHFRQLCSSFWDHLVPKSIEFLQLCLQNNANVDMNVIQKGFGLSG